MCVNIDGEFQAEVTTSAAWRFSLYTVTILSGAWNNSFKSIAANV